MNTIIRYIILFSGVLAMPLMTSAASLTLTSQSNSYKIGEMFSVGVYLNTEGVGISGVDLELTYPSSLLEVVDSDLSVAGTQIIPGTLMTNNQINTASNGRVRYAQIIYAGIPDYTSTAPELFATMQFRVLASGVAPITILHTLGNTRDSNVANTGKDILTSTTNLSLNLLTAEGTLLTSPVSISYTFSRDLRVGSKGDDVLQLQKFLNVQGFALASSGPGSPGNETTYFGPLTKSAIVKFQTRYATQVLVPVGITSGQGTGYFGPSTRKYVHSLSVGSSVPQSSSDAIQLLQQQILEAQAQLQQLMQQLQVAQQ
jgi:hypothetical protein